MYPDWPESPADLVPLPLCDGPKLEPFVFTGPQKIKFLEHIGEGLHSHVFKVEIQGRIYALKLVSQFASTSPDTCTEEKSPPRGNPPRKPPN